MYPLLAAVISAVFVPKARARNASIQQCLFQVASQHSCQEAPISRLGSSVEANPCTCGISTEKNRSSTPFERGCFNWTAKNVCQLLLDRRIFETAPVFLPTFTAYTNGGTCFMCPGRNQHAAYGVSALARFGLFVSHQHVFHFLLAANLGVDGAGEGGVGGHMANATPWPTLAARSSKGRSFRGQATA